MSDQQNTENTNPSKEEELKLKIRMLEEGIANKVEENKQLNALIIKQQNRSKRLSNIIGWYKVKGRVNYSLNKVLEKLTSDISWLTNKLSLKSWLAIFTFLVVSLEVWILFKQNTLFSIQNDKIIQQNDLIEAQRRSSYVFLMGNIMDAVNRELSNPKNKDRILTNELRGEIISLSHSLLPYRFILDGNMTRQSYSPERGMLLVFLLQAKINSSDLTSILTNGSFASSFLNTLSIDSDSVKTLTLTGSRIDRLIVTNSYVNELRCHSCEINNEIVFKNSDCINIWVDDENEFDLFVVEDCYFANVYFSINTVNSITFWNSEIYGITFYANDIYGMYLNECTSRDFRIACQQTDNVIIANSDITFLNLNSKARAFGGFSGFWGDSNEYSLTLNNITVRQYNFGGGLSGDEPVVSNPLIDKIELKNSNVHNARIKGKLKNLKVEDSIIYCEEEILNSDEQDETQFKVDGLTPARYSVLDKRFLPSGYNKNNTRNYNYKDRV